MFMWQGIKKGLAIASSIFTIIVLALSLYGLVMDFEVLDSFKLIISFVFILIGVGSYQVSRNLHFYFTPINYIIPYIISIGLIFGLDYLLVNYLNMDYLNLKKSISGYTVAYIIYITFMILKNIRNKDRIHF